MSNAPCPSSSDTVQEIGPQKILVLQMGKYKTSGLAAVSKVANNVSDPLSELSVPSSLDSKLDEGFENELGDDFNGNSGDDESYRTETSSGLSERESDNDACDSRGRKAQRVNATNHTVFIGESDPLEKNLETDILALLSQDKPLASLDSSSLSFQNRRQAMAYVWAYAAQNKFILYRRGGSFVPSKAHYFCSMSLAVNAKRHCSRSCNYKLVVLQVSGGLWKVKVLDPSHTHKLDATAYQLLVEKALDSRRRRKGYERLTVSKSALDKSSSATVVGSHSPFAQPRKRPSFTIAPQPLPSDPPRPSDLEAQEWPLKKQKRSSSLGPSLPVPHDQLLISAASDSVSVPILSSVLASKAPHLSRLAPTLKQQGVDTISALVDLAHMSRETQTEFLKAVASRMTKASIGVSSGATMTLIDRHLLLELLSLLRGLA
ncbi:hypothetical protein OIV83_001933 [Microbotryomycetes sp. JL201]|nr:hypothetical protein OIV83_001933 [Microbotryomycetes sp. JL201]